MSAVLPLARHKLSVEDYHRMGEAGILAPDERVELIEGEIIDMTPIVSPHAGRVAIFTRFFTLNLGESGVVFTQNPVRLSLNSEPQPDVMVLKPRADDYVDSLPAAADVLLLIEVSDTTVEYDRRIKVPLYARHGIAEVWVVDLNAELLEIYTKPSGNGYGSVQRLGKTESAVPSLFRIKALPLKDIWRS